MKTKKRKCNKLADKIIKEMQEAGLTHDQMLNVIKLAREKYELLKQE